VRWRKAGLPNDTCSARCTEYWDARGLDAEAAAWPDRILRASTASGQDTPSDATTVHAIRHVRSRELGAFANPKGRALRKNSAIGSVA
jgi:hypothetical protein